MLTPDIERELDRFAEAGGFSAGDWTFARPTAQPEAQSKGNAVPVLWLQLLIVLLAVAAIVGLRLMGRSDRP